MKMKRNNELRSEDEAGTSTGLGPVEKMLKKNKRKMPEYFSTHPNPDNRIKFLQANMNQAYALYVEAKNVRGETPNP